MTTPGSASPIAATAAAPGVGSARRPAGALTPVELNRLRWRCRRGMLENDLILARFLDARGGALESWHLAAFERLLALTDNELWDLLSARAEPEDAALAPLVAQLREA